MDALATTNQRFKFFAERAVDDLIKTGVQNTFTHYSKKTNRNADTVRNDISKALQSLATIVPSPKSSKAPPQKGPRPVKYFSATQSAQIEIFIDDDTDKMMIEKQTLHWPIDKRIMTDEQQRNEDFKAYVADWIDNALDVSASAVAQTVLIGIFSTLLQAEDTAGPFIKEFEKHIRLLKQLARIYKLGNVDDLDGGKGVFSHGMAVEEGLKAIEGKESKES